MSPATPHPPGPRVAAVSVSYGSEGVLESFFETLVTSAAEDLLIVLADNNAAAGTQVREISAAHGAVYLPMNGNAGYGGAINAAVAGLPATVEWILVSNPDVIFRKDAVDLLVARGDSDPMIAAVGPTILTAEGAVYPSARAIPSLRYGIGHALLGDLWRGNPWSAAYRNENAPHRRDVGWLSGACLLVRRRTFEEIGGFDEDFFMYFEDVDLGHRFGKQGYLNVYEPAAVVTHSGAHSTSTEFAAMVTAHHNSAKRFLAKRYSGVLLWPVRTVLSAGLDARAWFLNRKNSKERR